MNYDEATIKALIADATKRMKAAEKEWRKYDGAEAMHEMEGWQQAINWLKRIGTTVSVSR